MRILKIKTKTGIKTVYDVTDWGWSAETGDLYYRTEKGLHHKYLRLFGPAKYGGSTTAMSKNLSGNSLIPSMQFML